MFVEKQALATQNKARTVFWYLGAETDSTVEAGTAGGTPGAVSGNGTLLRDIIYIEFE